MGGGPAGAAVARRLALLGHEVCLLERAPFPRPHVGESLPPAILPLLEALGVRERVERAGFLRPERAIVRWSEAADRSKSQPGEPGFQVDRGHFDALLLDAAREAGVRVLQPATALRPICERPGHWWVPVHGSPGITSVRAAFWVDATGRRAVSGGRKRRLSPPTLAIYAYWRNTGIPGPETRVEAGEEAWYWGAPLPDGSFNATVFLDPARCGAAHGDLEPRYRALLRKSALMAACLDGELAGPVSACSATSYAAEAPAGETFLRAGEAGFCVDPLSSQGVMLAIQSALQASIVVHTLRTAPAHGDAAIRFYRERLLQTAARHAALAARHYAEPERYRDRPFWQARSPNPGAPAEPKRHFATRWGLHDRVRLSAEATIVATPCVAGDLIALRSALQHPALEGPVSYLEDIEVVPLLNHVRAGMTLWQIAQAWEPQLPLTRRLALAGWLAERGILSPMV